MRIMSRRFKTIRLRTRAHDSLRKTAEEERVRGGSWTGYYTYTMCLPEGPAPTAGGGGEAGEAEAGGREGWVEGREGEGRGGGMR